MPIISEIQKPVTSMEQQQQPLGVCDIYLCIYIMVGPGYLRTTV